MRKMAMDEKLMNGARKRFDTRLLSTMREFHGSFPCCKKDGVLWVFDSTVAMHYYEVDYHLDRNRLEESSSLEELVNCAGRYGQTVPAEITKYIPHNGSIYAHFNDGIDEILVHEKDCKIFGSKFIYCIHDNILAVFNNNELCGLITPLNLKEEEGE
jgi:hypothetical protein